MKKILFLFSAALVVLASCSKDDTNSSDAAPLILPKTMKYTFPSQTDENSFYTFVYNGNKIVSIKSEINRVDYTYNGNVIVKSTSYNTNSGKDLKNNEFVYTYANNKLATSSNVLGIVTQYPVGQYKWRNVYSYNIDGTIKQESYNTNIETGIENKSNSVNVSTFVNGNLVKLVSTDTSLGANYVSIQIVEYDSKNNPSKNILGFDLLLDNESEYSTNNIVKKTTTTTGSWSSESSFKREYIYDTNGYPTKITSYNSDGTPSVIIEYTY